MGADQALPLGVLQTAAQDQPIKLHFIEANMPALERFIRQYEERVYELVQLQYRARVIRDRHEPPAEKRMPS